MQLIRIEKQRAASIARSDVLLADASHPEAAGETVVIRTPGGEEIRMEPVEALLFARRMVELARAPLPT